MAMVVGGGGGQAKRDSAGKEGLRDDRSGGGARDGEGRSSTVMAGDYSANYRGFSVNN